MTNKLKNDMYYCIDDDDDNKLNTLIGLQHEDITVVKCKFATNYQFSKQKPNIYEKVELVMGLRPSVPSSC